MNKYSLILKECQKRCQKYDYILNFADIEDIVSITTINTLKYLPSSFASDQHCTNWIKLYTSRFCINAIRDFMRKRIRHSVPTYEINYNYEESEVKRWIGEENAKELKEIALERFHIQPPRHKRILLNSTSPMKKLEKKFNLTRWQIYNIKQNFKNDVLNYC